MVLPTAFSSSASLNDSMPEGAIPAHLHFSARFNKRPRLPKVSAKLSLGSSQRNLQLARNV
eukprot:2173395-Lingulodinium_polyedra.AAC.1